MLTFLSADVRTLERKIGEARASVEADEVQLQIALKKAQQQQEIIEQKIDVKTLVYALTRFKNLHQLRLMKVVDANDKWDK
jgi:hypothetical protein